MGSHHRTTTQQVPPQSDQEGDDSSEVTGTITLITKNEGCAQASLIEAYFNGDKSTMMVDICSGASIIHHVDNPAQDRIFKIRSKRTYYLPCRGDVNWRETNNDMELALADGNKETNYDELFWSSDDEDESSNDVELTLTERDKA